MTCTFVQVPTIQNLYIQRIETSEIYSELLLTWEPTNNYIHFISTRISSSLFWFNKTKYNIAQNSGSSLHGTSPKSTEGRRRLTYQANSIHKAPRSRSTPRSITAENNDDVSSLDTSTTPNSNSSPTTQQGNQIDNEEQGNSISNTPISASNEQTEENNINNTSPRTSNEAFEDNNA